MSTNDNLKKLFSLIPFNEIEVEAQDQIHKVVEHPFLVRMVAFPDIHSGYTLPVGSAALCKGVISPEFVGVDIGCGVLYCPTNLKAKKFNKNKLEKLYQKICEKIPVGFDSRTEALSYDEFMGKGFAYNDLIVKESLKLNEQRIKDRITKQLGTLGSGNHFAEVDVNQEGNIVIVVHSGSRNFGKMIADFYVQLSKLVCKELPDGFMHIYCEYGDSYFEDMKFCMKYARDNRRKILEDILEILNVDINECAGSIIDKCHNYAQVLGNGKVLHRKGAISAEPGKFGIIPGNMGDGSVIVVGMSGDEYLYSSGHGAGRRMSRSFAKKNLSIEKFEKSMKGIVGRVDKDLLDESPMAYKNFQNVLDAQEGKVFVVTDKLRPLIVVKG